MRQVWNDRKRWTLTEAVLDYLDDTIRKPPQSVWPHAVRESIYDLHISGICFNFKGSNSWSSIFLRFLQANIILSSPRLASANKSAYFHPLFDQIHRESVAISIKWGACYSLSYPVGSPIDFSYLAIYCSNSIYLKRTCHHFLGGIFLGRHIIRILAEVRIMPY